MASPRPPVGRPPSPPLDKPPPSRIDPKTGKVVIQSPPKPPYVGVGWFKECEWCYAVLCTIVAVTVVGVTVAIKER